MSAETSKEVKFVFVRINKSKTYRIRRHQSSVLGKRYYQVIGLDAQRILLIRVEGNHKLSFNTFLEVVVHQCQQQKNHAEDPNRCRFSWKLDVL